jgi:hypothetical protein
VQLADAHQIRAEQCDRVPRYRRDKIFKHCGNKQGRL